MYIRGTTLREKTVEISSGFNWWFRKTNKKTSVFWTITDLFFYTGYFDRFYHMEAPIKMLVIYFYCGYWIRCVKLFQSCCFLFSSHPIDHFVKYLKKYNCPTPYFSKLSTLISLTDLTYDNCLCYIRIGRLKNCHV